MVILKRYGCLISVICFIASPLLLIAPKYSIHITIRTILSIVVLIIGIVFVLIFYFMKGLSVFGRVCFMISPIIFWLFTSLSIILLMAGLVFSYLGDSKKKRNQ